MPFKFNPLHRPFVLAPDGDAVPAGAGANEGDTSNVTSDANLDAKINKAITGHIKRLESKVEKSITSAFSGDSFGKAIEAALEKIATTMERPAEQPSPTIGNDAVVGDPKLTMKALQEQQQKQNTEAEKRIKALEAQLAAQTKQATEAQAKMERERMRSDVAGKLTDRLGKSPLVNHLLKSLFDADGRFTKAEDGSTVMRFKRDYGDENVSLEEGLKEWFDSEGKDLLPARNGNLPPAMMGARGSMLRPNSQTTTPYNPLLAEVAKGVAERNPALGEVLSTAAGTPSK